MGKRGKAGANAVYQRARREANKLDRRARDDRKLAKQYRSAAVAAESDEVDAVLESGGNVLGGAAGGALGMAIGGPGGAAVGKVLGSLAGKGLAKFISTLRGHGEYEVESNTIGTTGGVIPEGTPIPTFNDDNSRYRTRISHAEFVGLIRKPTQPMLFDNTEYEINPANANLFPWLAGIAKNFQQWAPRGMALLYKSTSSDYAANSALGVLAMGTNYNVDEDKFSDLRNMLNTQYSTSAKPSLSQWHCVECDAKRRPTELLFVRTANSTASDAVQDDKFYDLGKFQIATDGMPGSAGEVIGELWVSYDIDFSKPIMMDSNSYTGYLVGTAGVSKTQPFGTTQLYRGQAIRLSTQSQYKVRFPQAGHYLVIGLVVGTGIPVVSMLTPQGPSPSGKYDQENVMYSIGIDALGNGTTTVVGCAAIRATRDFTYDFQTYCNGATTISSFKLFVFGANFDVLYGGLALMNEAEMAEKIRRQQLIDKERDQMIVLGALLKPFMTAARECSGSKEPRRGAAPLSQAEAEAKYHRLVQELNDLETQLYEVVPKETPSSEWNDVNYVDASGKLIKHEK